MICIQIFYFICDYELKKMQKYGKISKDVEKFSKLSKQVHKYYKNEKYANVCLFIQKTIKSEVKNR